METNWFTQSRFGMFIHWGLYSLPGGYWKGMETPWVAEWLMRKFKVPATEYETLAARFNPVHFDARRWVSTIRAAGMKYLIITAKHHDGFAMFHSRYDRYNIADATPFGRDPLAELAGECRKQGIRLGFYYSQDQDWHEPGASGNDWDFPDKTPAAFQAYLDGKVKTQLRELLTNYGEVAVIWFDTPNTITPAQSEELKEYVHRLQPKCLVSGRIGNGKGDYTSLGDNQLPDYPAETPCEGLGTMNESWGYKPYDHHYRSTAELLRILANMISKNTNYLLNVGPDALGRFPAPALLRLRRIGDFMQVNNEAVYGCGACGIIFPVTFPWGCITANERAIYLWIFRKNGPEIIIYGIRNKITGSSIIGHPGKPAFEQTSNRKMDYHKLTLSMPVGLRYPFVIKLSLDGKLNVNSKSYFSSDF